MRKYLFGSFLFSLVFSFLSPASNAQDCRSKQENLEKLRVEAAALRQVIPYGEKAVGWIDRYKAMAKAGQFTESLLRREIAKWKDVQDGTWSQINFELKLERERGPLPANDQVHLKSLYGKEWYTREVRGFLYALDELVEGRMNSTTAGRLTNKSETAARGYLARDTKRQDYVASQINILTQSIVSLNCTQFQPTENFAGDGTLRSVDWATDTR